MSLDYSFLRPLADDLTRIPPQGAPGDYRTFGMAAPLATHFVPADCREVDCPDYLHGFRCHVESIGPRLADAARNSGRKFTEVSYGEGHTWLEFEAGQPCFSSGPWRPGQPFPRQKEGHMRRLEREDRFYMRAGDYRAKGRVVEVSATAWVDEFGEHQERIAAQVERG